MSASVLSIYQNLICAFVSSVSVNCAHLHPRFGEKTPEQQLKEMKEEEEAGEVDLNLQEYKQRRLKARQSPYPSIVVEVRAMAPPDFTPPPPAPSDNAETDENKASEKEEPITSEYVQQLESLFAKSSIAKDNEFYDTIGDHIESISSMTPMSLAQQWVDKNDPKFQPDKCAFTSSDTAHVDEAYEFVFANMAMQSSQFGGRAAGFADAGAQKRQYLVLPNFVSTSATSMEKFSMEVANIIAAIPSLAEKVELSCLHPEHIETSKRSPVPIFILKWKD